MLHVLVAVVASFYADAPIVNVSANPFLVRQRLGFPTPEYPLMPSPAATTRDGAVTSLRMEKQESTTITGSHSIELTFGEYADNIMDKEGEEYEETGKEERFTF